MQKIFRFFVCSHNRGKIAQQRFSPEKETQENILKGRNQYKTCMNFVISLSTTLNQGVFQQKKKKFLGKTQ